jgi:glutathione S-transferase
MLTLISATPSPFARMNRIALTLKGIPFRLKNEIPWHPDTQTPTYNPLEKLPILLFDDGREPVYDSSHIQECIVAKYAEREPKLLTGDMDLGLKARQILTLSQGLLDAFVLRFFEVKRDQDKQSKQWLDRQERKIDGAMKAMNELVKAKGSSEYLLGGKLTIADIAVVCAVSQIDWGGIREGWQEKLPELAGYWKNLDMRDGWRESRPVMFDLKDCVV